MPRQSLSDYETEQFLHLVEQHSLVYNPKHASYKDQEVVSNAWTTIANEMGRETGNCYSI